MEKMFKKKLLNLKKESEPSTFEKAIFSSDIDPFQLDDNDSCEKAISRKQEEIIQSIEKYALKKIQKSSPEKDFGKIQSDGAEIVLKPRLTLNKEIGEVLLRGKRNDQLKVIFVSEAARALEEITTEEDPFLGQLKLCFPDSASKLFQKMVQAMNLDPEEIIVYPIEGFGIDLLEDIEQLCANFNIKILVTLGSKSAQRILERSDRLTMFHGQFFLKKFKNGVQVQVISLFHPSILETNVNMKKTAWVDMQKIMRYLENLS